MSFAKSLYARSPVLLQNGLISLKGAQFELVRSDRSSIARTHAFLVGSERWSAQQHRNYQTHQLRRHLEHAFASIPYYRDLPQSSKNVLRDLRGPEDIRRLPVLEKAVVREDPRRFVDPSVPGWRLVRGHTSGTTGTPISLFETRASMSRRFAFIARLRTWAGFIDNPFTPRRASFTGRDIVPSGAHADRPPFWRYNLPANQLLLSSSHVSRKSAAGYLEAIDSFGAELLDGYPSAMLPLARLLREMDLPRPRLRAIITTAETLEPQHKEELERVFGCPVFDQYSSSESTCFWSTCEYGAYHMSPEYGISEILDANGQPVRQGEEGDVVVTSFLNPTMPLIRYRLGDRAIAGEASQCPCGRHMPTVERVVGRQDDILFFPQRGYVGRLDPVFKGSSGIVEAQIVQEDFRRVTLKIVPAHDFARSTAEGIRKGIVEKVGSGVVVDVVLVDSIPRGPNGKLRSVISRVPRTEIVRHSCPDEAANVSNAS